MISLDLVESTFISIDRNVNGTFGLIVAANGSLEAITKLINEKSLVIEKDRKIGYSTVYKPYNV